MLDDNLINIFDENNIIKWHLKFKLSITQICEIFNCNPLDVREYFKLKNVIPRTFVVQGTFLDEKIVNSWKILSDYYYIDKYNHRIYLCQCTKCGRIQEVRMDNIKSNRNIGCSFCYKDFTYVEELLSNTEKKVLKSIFNKMKKRIEKSLRISKYNNETEEHFQQRIKRAQTRYACNIQWWYLGYIYLLQDKKSVYSQELLIKENTRNKDQIISIDRIDSSKGYVFGNIQLITKQQNDMKGILSDDDFREELKKTRKINL